MGAGDFLFLASCSLVFIVTELLILIQFASATGILAFLLQKKEERLPFVPFLLLAACVIIFVKKPSKVKSILDVVLSNHLVSLATIMSKQSIRLQFISEIFSVEMKFFDQYQEDKRTDRFDNIIPLYKRNNL